jgi:hypothetical protein
MPTIPRDEQRNRGRDNNYRKWNNRGGKYERSSDRGNRNHDNNRNTPRKAEDLLAEIKTLFQSNNPSTSTQSADARQ